MILKVIIDSLVFILPSYVANASPVLTPRLIHNPHPIDGGRLFLDGKRILGDGKTVEGFLIGVAAGTLTGLILQLLSLHTVIEALPLSLGALLGDCLGSFIKRRMGLKRGDSLHVADQLLFLVFSLTLYSLAFKPPPLSWVLFLLVFTPIAHRLTNYVAYRLGLKPVPW